jgi:glycosyltransferase involved in cell wall biosynthesis
MKKILILNEYSTPQFKKIEGRGEYDRLFNYLSKFFDTYYIGPYVKYRLSNKRIIVIKGGKLNFFLKSLLKIRRIKPDLIVACSPLVSGIVAFLSNLLFGIKYICLCGSMFVKYQYFRDLFHNRSFVRRICNKFLLEALQKLSFSRASGVSVWSKALKEEVERLGAKNIQIICISGINLKKFNPKAKPLYNFNKKYKNILYAGRLSPEKGLDNLFFSFSILVKKYKDIRLFVYSFGPYVKYYKNLARKLKIYDYVTFRRSVPYERLPSLLKSFHLVVVPSLSEGFGWVALESMAVGVPVIASNVDGLKENVTNEVTGLLVPPDPHKLAKAIKRLLFDKKLYNTLRKNGLHFVKKFDENLQLKKFLKFIYAQLK